MAFGKVVATGVSGSDSRAVLSTTRHHGSTPSACAGSTGSPRRGITSCTPALGPSSSKVSAGWSQACIARLNVPQCTGRKAPAHFHHDEVERPEPFADRLVFRGEARIAAEKHGVARGSDDERRPQG